MTIPNEIKEQFRNGEFDNEEYLVAAIKRWLITPTQKECLYSLDLSIEDILNGRFGGVEEKSVYLIFDVWNMKLGFSCFHT